MTPRWINSRQVGKKSILWISSAKAQGSIKVVVVDVFHILELQFLDETLCLWQFNGFLSILNITANNLCKYMYLYTYQINREGQLSYVLAWFIMARFISAGPGAFFIVLFINFVYWRTRGRVYSHCSSSAVVESGTLTKVLLWLQWLDI